MPDPLLLSTGQHRRTQTFLAEQADQIERGPHPPAHPAMAMPGRDQRQRHVVEHGPFREQAVVLEHHTDMPPIQRDVARPEA